MRELSGLCFKGLTGLDTVKSKVEALRFIWRPGGDRGGCRCVSRVLDDCSFGGCFLGGFFLGRCFFLPAVEFESVSWFDLLFVGGLFFFAPAVEEFFRLFLLLFNFMLLPLSLLDRVDPEATDDVALCIRLC